MKTLNLILALIVVIFLTAMVAILENWLLRGFFLLLWWGFVGGPAVISLSKWLDNNLN